MIILRINNALIDHRLGAFRNRTVLVHKSDDLIHEPWNNLLLHGAFTWLDEHTL